MMTLDSAALSTERAVVMECRTAVHIASTASGGSSQPQASPKGGSSAVRDLVWDTTAPCSMEGLPTGAWVAVRFAYPLPEGAVLLDVRADERPIERNGRLVGVAFVDRALVPQPLRFSIRVKNVSRGPSAKLTPPLLEGDAPQIVAFGNSDLSFEPRNFLDPQSRASAMAITLGDFSHDAYRDALREGKVLDLHWDGPAIVLRATRPIHDAQGIEGELVERADKTKGLYIGVGLVGLAAAVGLVLVALRFKRQSEDEHAEALLRAEIDSL